MNARFFIGLSLAFLLFVTGPSNSLFAQVGSTGKVENLAFKILQKQAADYELALNELITRSLKKYIPEDRFYLSVRIFWNPAKMQQVKQEISELSKKSGKLPGFPIFVKDEERSLDYYMGTGSVMKLKVEVLLDETLPKHLDEFIYNVVPVQARFVADRGDSIVIQRIPFPAGSPIQPGMEMDVPLTMEDSGTTVLDAIQRGQKEVANAKPVILHPVLQKYVSRYEEYINDKLKGLISQYIDKNKYLMQVKFYWNPDEINKLKNLVIRSDTEGKVKLPGFTIFLEEQEPFYEMVASSMNLMRMEINVMIDDSVSPDVEPFLNKLIPMTVKVIPERGDEMVVYRGHFPKAGVPTSIGRIPDEQVISREIDVEVEIDNAFRKGNYRKGLILIDMELSKRSKPEQRLDLLKKKGSLHLMLQERDLAKSAWKRVLQISPADKDTVQLLEQMK